MSLRKTYAYIVLISAMALIVAPNLFAGNGAIVVNHGQQLGSNCDASVASIGWHGYGFIDHFVVTPSGVINLGCQLWGPPVANTTDYNGLKIDPTGHAVLSENGRN